MRRCRLALLAAVLGLFLGSDGAMAQEPAPLPVEPAATPAGTATPVAEPAAPAPAADPADAPVSPASPAAPEPVPAAPEPVPAAPEPAPAAAAPAPAAAAPTTAAPAPAPAATAKRAAVRPRVRRRSVRAPNQERADGRIVLLDGHVSIGALPPARCAPESDCVLADYEVSDLEVRADLDGPALIAVTRARAHGPDSDRRIEADVTLRPPGGESQQDRLELDPGDDLLDPATYRGTSLEAAFDDVLQALLPLTGKGGALEGLVITFGAGFVKEEGAAAVGVSTRTEGFVVFAPLDRGGPRSPVSLRVKDSPDAGGDPQGETGKELVVPHGGVLGSETGGGGGGGGGGGPATAVAEFASSVFGALVTGACQAVGDREDCDASEAPPPFTVVLLTAVLFVADDGRGLVDVRCPAGYEGVTGVVQVSTEIRLGEAVRRLAEDVRFSCDQSVEAVRIRLRPDALRRLEDEERLTARLEAIVFTGEGLRDGDVSEQVSIRLRSREGGPG